MNDFGTSYWHATARGTFVGTEGPLPRSVGVLVIGGGYTGLAAANHLAVAHGARPIVLERGAVGAGASGRNAGMVVPHVGKLALSKRYAEWGVEGTQASIDLGLEAASRLSALVEEEGLEAGFQAADWVIEAASGRHATALRAQGKLYERLGYNTVCFEEPQRGDATGRFGALVHFGCALVHPVDLTHALAARAVSNGARIFEGVSVGRVSRVPRGACVRTDRGDVVARRVVFATNGYTNRHLHRSLSGRIARFRAYLVATAPISDAVWTAIMPHGHRFATDSRKLVRYWRRLPNGGMLFGGPGPVAEWRRDYVGVRQVVNDLHKRFPALRGHRIDHAWRGTLGATWDRMPHVAAIDELGAYALGYAGTGVALAIQAGEAAADLAQGAAPDSSLRPVLGMAPHFPLRPLMGTYPTAARLGYAIRDRRP